MDRSLRKIRDDSVQRMLNGMGTEVQRTFNGMANRSSTEVQRTFSGMANRSSTKVQRTLRRRWASGWLRPTPSGKSLDQEERDILDRGLVSLIRHRHDEIDALAAQAYGWVVDLPVKKSSSASSASSPSTPPSRRTVQGLH